MAHDHHHENHLKSHDEKCVWIYTIQLFSDLMPVSLRILMRFSGHSSQLINEGKMSFEMKPRAKKMSERFMRY